MNWHDAYTLKDYGGMIADAIRMRAYRDALAKAIKPGAIVLDIGTGTGIMALLACQLGAAKVHALDTSNATAVGAELARANGFAGRISFSHGASFDLQLAQKADVIVSDLRGTLPFHSLNVRSIVDARTRLLAPGGTLIPQKDTVRVQLVTAAKAHDRLLAIWKKGAFGLDLTPGLRWASHQWGKADFAGATLLEQPQTAFELDYRTVSSPNASGTVAWTIGESGGASGGASGGLAHGIAAWFDATLSDGISFSSAPDQPALIYGQAFFPFPEPQALRAGDEVELMLAGNLVGGSYVWRWNTRISGPGRTQPVVFQQSTLQAMLIDPARLQARAATFTPVLSERGLAAARALALMRENLPLESIAATLHAEFGSLFRDDAGAAHDFVADLAESYSKP